MKRLRRKRGGGKRRKEKGNGAGGSYLGYLLSFCKTDESLDCR